MIGIKQSCERARNSSCMNAENMSTKWTDLQKHFIQSSRRPLPRLNNGLLPSSSGKQKARQMKGALWRPVCKLNQGNNHFGVGLRRQYNKSAPRRHAYPTNTTKLYHKGWTQWCEQRDISAQLIMTKQLKTPKRSWGTTGITSGSLNAPK